MSKRVFATIILILTVCFAVEAKDPFGQRIKHWRERTLLSSCDTDYIALPKYNWQATTGLKAGGSSLHLIWPGEYEMPRNPIISDDGKIRMFKQNRMVLPLYDLINSSVAIGLAYKGFGLTFGPKLYNPNKGRGWDLGIDFTGTRFGIDAGVRLLVKEDPNTKNDYLLLGATANLYCVINPGKFNLSAAYSQSVIQKKSAGSFIVGASFLTNYINLLGEGYGNQNSNISLGVGYGYNLVFLNGRVLIHASYIPMYMFGKSTWCFYNDQAREESIKMPKDPTFPYRHLARASANYTWKDRYLIGFNLYNAHYGISHNIKKEVGLNSKYPQSANEWSAMIFFKYRFNL